jgi:predicted phage terminase large subunit-like protein
MNEHILRIKATEALKRMTGSDAPVDVKGTKAAQLKNRTRRELESSLYDFTQAAWSVIDPAPFIGGGFAMQAVCDHLQSCVDGHIRNLIINIPPRFSKSTLCGVLFPAWVFAQRSKSPTSGNGVQFLHASYSQTLALQDSLKCRRLLESDWYQNYWGDRVRVSSDQNTKSQFDLESGGRRMTTSVGGSTTGLGGQFLICDDPNNARESNSDVILKSTIEWWDMAWSTRLNDPKTGCRVVIQQRLNERDITGHILTQDVGNWTHLMLPMEFEVNRRIYTVLVPAAANDGENDIVWTDPRTEEGELLWPERFGQTEVDELKGRLGPYGTAGQLQMRPRPMGGGIIQRTWWEPWSDDKFPDMEINIGSLDLAYTLKKENDFSAMTCWGVFRDSGGSTAVVNRDHHGNVVTRISKSDQGADVPKIMLTNGWMVKLEFHDLVAKIIETAREAKLDILLVEAKGPGISVAQEIRRLVGIEEFSVREISPNDLDKVARMYAVQHLFAEGLVYAPTKVGDPDTFRIWADQVITEVESFPKGLHDDIPDTVSQAMNFMRKAGMIQRGVERTYELTESQRFAGNNNDTPLYPS